MAFAATVLTLYPAMFPGPLGQALSGRALAEDVWSLETVDIRDFARDKHRSVDDTPAGGGPGMVMRADVLISAIDAALAAGPAGRPLVHLTPRGAPLSQARLRDWSQGPGLVLVCGRFEGIDERVYRARPGIEISLGDFVLSGGELAALAVLDGIVRLLPGVMGTANSAAEESFENGLLEYPHFTRPKVVQGEDIPEVLTSGDHGAIAAWRLKEAERITQARRPDLFARHRMKKD
jgi:tRNA (guanine37-N1)-methyltransferase